MRGGRLQVFDAGFKITPARGIYARRGDDNVNDSVDLTLIDCKMTFVIMGGGGFDHKASLCRRCAETGRTEPMELNEISNKGISKMAEYQRENYLKFIESGSLN